MIITDRMSRVEKLANSLGLMGKDRHLNQSDLKGILETNRRGRLSKKIERAIRQAQRKAAQTESSKILL